MSISILSRIFRKRNEKVQNFQDMEFKGLIVGLGNPGAKYAETRHNIGFMAVDHLLQLAEARKSMRLKAITESGDYQLWSITMAGHKLLIAKPMTFMNLSGKAVAKICGRHNVSIDQVVVLHDELDLPPGRMKFKRGGSTNGHRGLESIVEHMRSGNYYRLRFGIGRPEGHQPVRDWVLEDFDQESRKIIPGMMKTAVKGLDLFYRRGMQPAVQLINSFSPAMIETK